MNSYQRQVLPAPFEIVSDDRCAMGTYNSPIQNVNLTESLAVQYESMKKA